MNEEFPESYTVPNPYNIPIHDQGNKSSCTSHSLATIFEYRLSEQFKEQVLIDADDLWDKQLMYGTAIEGSGDTMDDAFEIANKYGMIFRSASGISGIFKPSVGFEFYKCYKFLVETSQD